MADYTRRRLLAIGGAVTAGALAGCSGGGPTGNAASASDGTALEAITLENLNDRSHTLDIIIQRNDEIDHWTTHELSAVGDDTSSQELDADWSTEPGAFQLTVRLDDDSRAQFSSSQLADRDCLDLVVMVTRQGELTILTDVSGGSCSAEADTGNE